MDELSAYERDEYKKYNSNVGYIHGKLFYKTSDRLLANTPATGRGARVFQIPFIRLRRFSCQVD